MKTISVVYLIYVDGKFAGAKGREYKTHDVLKALLAEEKFTSRFDRTENNMVYKQGNKTIEINIRVK